MINCFAVTINLSPYKKWDYKFVNELLNTYGEGTLKLYKAKNWNTLDHEDQELVLKACANSLVKSVNGLDATELRFELTEKSNKHLHFYIMSDDNLLQNERFMYRVGILNTQFSSGLRYMTCHIEETILDVKYWKKYINKDVWLQCLTRSNFPEGPLSEDIEE